MNKPTVGFALCGSFCTFSKAIKQMEILVKSDCNVIPIMSYNAYGTDTRFGKAEDINNKIEEICGNKIINSIVGAEPLGPKKMLDLLLVAPCTGNTLAKITNAVTDTPVTMAVKSHLRTGRSILIALASNDSLGASAQNIGKALNTKNIYFVPFSQDDPYNKPNSLVAHFDLIPKCIELAIKKEQYQPLLMEADKK